MRQAVLLGVILVGGLTAAAATLDPEPNPLALPEPGRPSLRILSPDIVEVFVPALEKSAAAPKKGFFSSLFGGGEGPATGGEWNISDAGDIPKPGQFEVHAAGQPVAVQRVGFRRRPIYAPLKNPQLWVGQWLTLELARPLPEGASVEVLEPGGRLWKKEFPAEAVFDPARWSPAIHVNQTGYPPSAPKKAMIGYYLGSLGELTVPLEQGFDVLDAATGKIVFHGTLGRRMETGFTFPCYQQVAEAEFSALTTPGNYVLSVPGLGRSWPFRIDEGIAAAFARGYALGLYHQRCGVENALPFTRFTHGACHTQPAAVPTRDFKKVEQFLAKAAEESGKNAGQKAPPLSGVDKSLFPFVRSGKVDVSGGHHDAGDYSKYTINSAQLIHSLVFAADAFPGVLELDNLGVPESGDGRSDVLQEAKLEADFLAKMQDDDGGFYFLIYPRERKYENDVLPDRGDPQIVAPKITSASAAATAALAQAASSPAFKKQFPKEAALYAEKAKKGWAFLERAWAARGRGNCYQRLTHYGDFNQDDDETIWAAAEMFLLTGDPAIQQKLVEWFDPSDKRTWRWGWWSLYEAYGCAARSFAFADRTGRLPREKLDPILLDKCVREIRARAHDCARDARANSYNFSFPEASKRFKNGGWFFPDDTAFDITVGWQLDPRPEFADAVLGNLNYAAGCNPVNVSFLTGMGWMRQREIVHQYAQNDDRVLPPSGIPLGAVQAGFPYLAPYQKRLRELCFPRDDEGGVPYAFYDRWGDTFNVATEFTIVNQGRALASLAFWMAQSPLKSRPWRSAAATIKVRSEGSRRVARLETEGIDPATALTVWESDRGAPFEGEAFEVPSGARWIEAEAQWPDGRRAFARKEL